MIRVDRLDFPPRVSLSKLSWFPARNEPTPTEPQESFKPSSQPRWLDNLKAGAIAYGIPLGLAVGGAAVWGALGD